MNTLFLQIVYHHVGTHDLTLRNNALLFERCKKIFGKRTKIFEFAYQELAGLRLVFIRRIQLVYMLHVFLFQCVNYLIGAFRILLVEIIGYLYQRVGSAGHGRQDNKCLLT